MVYTIFPVTASTADNVAKIFRAVYADDFPMRYVYHADQVMFEIDSGRLCAVLAFDPAGEVIGYASVYRSSPNPSLWEGGNLVTLPGHRESGLAWSLQKHFMLPGSLPSLQVDGYLCESVCHHYFTQVWNAKLGFYDCAIALDQLSGASFTVHRPDTERVSCVVQFFEQSDQPEPMYLPHRYAERLRLLAKPFRPRQILESMPSLPESGATAYSDQYFQTADTWKISMSAIGADLDIVLEQVLTSAKLRNVISLQLIVSAASPFIGAAVEMMRDRGFFFGGLFPRWFGADGIMLQQVLRKNPDYEGIKVYSSEAKELLAFIRTDRDSVHHGQAR